MLACEQAFLFGRVKRVSRERASERRSREGLAPLAQIGELARRLPKCRLCVSLQTLRARRKVSIPHERELKKIKPL